MENNNLNNDNKKADINDERVKIALNIDIQELVKKEIPFLIFCVLDNNDGTAMSYIRANLNDALSFSLIDALMESVKDKSQLLKILLSLYREADVSSSGHNFN